MSKTKAHSGPNSFVLEGRLPGLNEMIAQTRRDKMAGARQKHKVESGLILQIRQALRTGSCWMPERPVWIQFDWYERTRRRDLDNIYAAKKWILDAMQAAGLLADDSQRFVVGLRDDFYLDRHEHIVVTLYETGGK